MKSGFFEGLEIARFARRNGLKLMIGAMMESALAITASAHFAAGLGGFDFIDLDSAFFMKETVTRGNYVAGNGTYDLSKVKAGIGVFPLA